MSFLSAWQFSVERELRLLPTHAADDRDEARRVYRLLSETATERKGDQDDTGALVRWVFRVIEYWIENEFLLKVFPPELAAEYLAACELVASTASQSETNS